MATYVLIHGSSSIAWSWYLVAAELQERGHDVVAPDLPCDDESAGLTQYADTVVDDIGDRTDLIVVGHSFGGYTAPLVCDRVPADLLVLVAGMVPMPGERPVDWWGNTGYERAWAEQTERDGETPTDELALFYHDVPRDLAEEALRRGRGQSGTPFEQPWPLAAWPDLPTRILLCRDDRFFPVEFMRRIARERLGIIPDEIDGGHYLALSHPKELADRLETYRTEGVNHG